MALNINRQNVQVLTLAVASGTLSGDVVHIGDGIVGIALTDRDANGNASVRFGSARTVVTATVRGVDGSGNSAVAIGNRIFSVSADTPKLSKKATGALFGYALGTVSSGASTAIQILMV